jgi:hypothetical protein
MKSSSNRFTKKRNLFSLFLFSGLLISAVSCQKGTAGPAGPPGTANVIYSDWFTPAAYVKDTVFGSYGFSYDTAIAGLTEPIIDSGTVIVFGQLDGYVTNIWPTGQTAALPITITYMDGASPNIDTWSALLSLGNLKIQLISSLNAYGGISNSHHFRYVIIPGGVKASAVSPSLQEGGIETNAVGASAGNPDYTHMSYSQICTQLHIPE